MANAPAADFALAPLPAAVRRVLFFVAMEHEAAPIADALGLARAGDARVGRIAGAEIVLLTPGIDPATQVDRIGPVHASTALTRALAHAREPFDLVVNAGTAGGFESQGQRVADLVVARDTLFHDARVAIDGFDRVARAHTRLSADESLLARLAAALDARAGLVSTGSSLDATADELAAFRRSGALAKEMELAALAVACRVHAVPLVALKGITDLVDHHEPTHGAFLRNLERTAARVAAASGPFLESMCARVDG
jgi:5'-methylthioadenosine/S-adenosylhomocysteine nucleosidase